LFHGENVGSSIRGRSVLNATCEYCVLKLAPVNGLVNRVGVGRRLVSPFGQSGR